MQFDFLQIIYCVKLPISHWHFWRLPDEYTFYHFVSCTKPHTCRMLGLEIYVTTLKIHSITLKIIVLTLKIYPVILKIYSITIYPITLKIILSTLKIYPIILEIMLSILKLSLVFLSSRPRSKTEQINNNLLYVSLLLCFNILILLKINSLVYLSLLNIICNQLVI